MRGNNVPIGMMKKVLNRGGLPKRQMDLVEEMADQASTPNVEGDNPEAI